MSDFRRRIEQLSQKRLVLLALELQSRIEEMQKQAAEPVAVIGMGCRIPGAGEGADAFWRLLSEGRDAISQVPPERWDAEAYYDPDPDAPGRTATLWGAFLADIDRFDASLFHISRREAVSMDPQQRLLLEVCWEALEDAGQSPRKLSGTATGVFVGLSTNDYYHVLLRRGEEAIDAYLASGTAHSVAAGRISYALGLEGPSLAVDTSCSSSLVAVHLACQSLRQHECRLALAGGANAILAPEVTIALSKAHMMAADGRCKAFDSGADGFVRGEGCGVVALKRLSDARADGDRILAVIRGSAVNQDGRSSGLTAPNGAAQEAVLRQALENARVGADEIAYVETHGTGTSLGDPIEAHALAAVLGTGRAPENPLVIGSVKTNIGHLEAAAGIAGLIKTVLALEHGLIPKHLHFTTLNPHIDWAGAVVEIPREAIAWPRGGGRRIAGVSSFGFSGTNAHVIVEEAPEIEPVQREFERPVHVLTISGRSEAALKTVTTRYAENLAGREVDLGDFCFTANAGRACFEERAAFIAASPEAMREALERAPAARAKRKAGMQPVFLFPGQGAQFAGMGSELYRTHPEFRRVMEECAEVLKAELEEPLLEVLWGARTDLLDQTRYTQPALFAIEYALAQLWRSWGIEPAAVVGHSVGEYAAACVAGVYDLADGLKFIARRAALMQAMPGRGGMSAVFASEGRVAGSLSGLESEVRIAALNAAESLVISGYIEGLEIAEGRLERAGIRVQRLAVSHAFHSPQIAGMEAELEEAAGRIRWAPPRVELISSVTGRPAAATEMSDPAYWRRQVHQPVRFQAAMETLAARGCEALLEVGPGTTLQGLAKQTITAPDAVWAGSLRRNRGEWQEMLANLGRLWAHGAEVDWCGFDRPYRRRHVALPTHPLERQRYWTEETVRRPGATARTADKTARDDWFYKLVWERKNLRSRPGSVASAGELAASLSERASLLRAEHGLDRYDAVRQELNPVCTDFIVEALRVLGWDLAAGDAFRKPEIVLRCGIAERHRMLFNRLLAILVDDEVLARDGDTYQVRRTPRVANPAAAIAELRMRYPSFGPELEMTARCAAQLASVLQDQTDPLQLLFPAGSFDTAEAIYTSSPGPQVFNRLAADVVAAEVKARSCGDIRLLEIGAGTGGTTAYMVPLLPEGRTEYAFTDVSSSFPARARQKFKECPFFRYQTLDIEKDPATQGFEREQFDIVLAANVLHATVDLTQTFGHIRSLLAPGGILVLIEGTHPEPWVDLTFGLTDGWWRFRDRALRPAYPLLSRAGWIKLLQESGFTEVGAVQPLEGSQQSVFFGRVPQSKLTPGRCLLLPDATGMANSLAQQIERAGGNAAVIEADASIAQHLGPSEDWDHIIDMRPAGDLDIGDMSAAQVAEDALRSAAGPLETVQAMARNHCAAKLWVVTRGAQAVLASDAAPAVTQSTAWGIARCIRLEHPGIWGGVLDLDPHAAPGENAGHCLASLLGNSMDDDGDDQAAFRDGQRYVPRLVRCNRPAPREVKIRSDRAYLITGGLGGIGLRVAQWLVECGAGEIILATRSGLPDRAHWDGLASGSAQAQQALAIAAMEDVGARVNVAALDVADESALASLLERLPAGKLGGIIHAAAALAGSPLVEMTRDDLTAMMRAKTQGTWALHRATRSMNLDFFVLFSSNSSLMGARNLAHYAAGNQFLDGFAHYRGRQGLAAISVNWGAWPHFGKTSDADRDKFYRGGLVPMPWEGALAALHEVIQSNLRHIFIGDFNWSVVKPLYESQRRLPLLAQVCGLPSLSEKQPEQRQLGASAVLSQLERGGAARTQALIQYLQNALASMLRTEAADMDPDRSVTDFGVDSLIALELRNRLDAELHFSIPTVSILQGLTLRDLAQRAGESLPSPASPAQPEGPAVVADFPLSFGQQAQWFAHKFMPDSSTFNVAFTAKASPCVAWDAFVRAMEQLVARHPALRTMFIEDSDGRPLQRVLAQSDADAELIDAVSWTDEELSDAILRSFRQTFPLDRPPFRVRVYRRPDGDVIFFNVDHIIIDAWSLRICFAELRQLYATELGGLTMALPPVLATYKEFVREESRLVEGPEGERLWSYWKTQLAGDLPLLRLPSSRPRPAVLTAQGSCIPLEFGPSRSAGVHQLARDQKATPYAVLLAAFNLLLYRYTGQTDIVVGTSASGREKARWTNAVGYFVNLLPLRTRILDHLTFSEYLVRTRDTVFAALENQGLPFAHLVTRLRVRRNLERSPVFQAFFNFVTDRSGELGPLFMGVRDCAVEFGNSVLRPSIIIPQQEGQSEVVLQLTESESELIGNLNYNSEILDRDVADEMAGSYCRILESVIRDPNIRVDEMKSMLVKPGLEREDVVF